MSENQDDLSKVLWRCRRGTLELDVMLKGFCEAVYPTLSSDKQKLFVEILEEQDQDLQRWLTGGHPCEKSQFQDMLLVIRHMHNMLQAQAV